MAKSNLPKQVQKQADEAEALEQALTAGAQGEQDPVSPQEGTGQAEATEAVAETADELTTSDGNKAPEAPTEPSPEDALKKQEQKYKTLQGMLKKEQETSRSTIADLSSKVEALTNQLETLTAKNGDDQKAAAATTDPLVTDKDVDDYGADMVDLIKRGAAEVVQEALNGRLVELDRKIEEISNQVGGVTQTQQVASEQTYFSELEKVVPDYQTINEDVDFLAWLDEVDPLSGLQRQAYLNNAFGNRNVRQTAELFNAYKRDRGLVEVPTVSEVPTPQVPPLERQLQPESSTASEAPVASNSKVWTPREIEKFYADKRRGAYTEEQGLRIESEIDAAVSEGRIKAA